MTTQKFAKLTECADRSYDHFAETIKLYQKEGYLIGGFGKIDKLWDSERSVIMRHDIDFSLKSALSLAGLEDILGISATYFISIHRPHYSPLTSETRKTVHALLDHGHEIGLHYEPEFDDLQAEIDMLEHYLDCDIVAIARHNPFGNKIDVDKSNKPSNVIDAYGDGLMKDFKYLSDSSGIWREGCFCGWCKHPEKSKLQVLIHPEWWATNTLDPIARLEEINSVWTNGTKAIADKAVRNLQIHREKIQHGEA